MIGCSSRRRLLQIQTLVVGAIQHPLLSFGVFLQFDWRIGRDAHDGGALLTVMAVFALLGGGHGLFLSLGWCHSLCTMAFHCLGVKNPSVRVHSCIPFTSHLPLDFSKGALGRLIRMAVVA